MSIKHSLLPEFDHEMATTRRLLDRVPEDRGEWRPHPKSKTMGELAAHIAELPGFVASVITLPSYDFLSAQGSRRRMKFETAAGMLEALDRGVTAAHDVIDAMTDVQMMETWSLLRGGKAMFTLPRAGVFRTLLLSHIIHHRGQLSVYLRLNDVPLPVCYGSTADES